MYTNKFWQVGIFITFIMHRSITIKQNQQNIGNELKIMKISIPTVASKINPANAFCVLHKQLRHLHGNYNQYQF